MNVKIRNKFIEIKYSVSNGLVILKPVIKSLLSFTFTISDVSEVVKFSSVLFQKL